MSTRAPTDPMLPRILTEPELAAMPTSQLFTWITTLAEDRPWAMENLRQIHRANVIGCQTEIDKRLPPRIPRRDRDDEREPERPRPRIEIPRPPDPPGAPPRITGQSVAPDVNVVHIGPRDTVGATALRDLSEWVDDDS